ncbi:unnamed protein product [Periconia digitata]|uniref:Uncharacterized protein n=1 Tax=Periconia digitata TaxID=1303443 RepID=A0A9W4UFN1_9PLEO|nr:unnamed protein product [Periconia digitata]
MVLPRWGSRWARLKPHHPLSASYCGQITILCTCARCQRLHQAIALRVFGLFRRSLE